jgi:hypothetical protein
MQNKNSTKWNESNSHRNKSSYQRVDLDLELRKRTLGERGGKEKEESEEENPNVLRRHDWKLWTGW